jgi:hypothetical protein
VEKGHLLLPTTLAVVEPATAPAHPVGARKRPRRVASRSLAVAPDGREDPGHGIRRPRQSSKGGAADRQAGWVGCSTEDRRSSKWSCSPGCAPTHPHELNSLIAQRLLAVWQGGGGRCIDGQPECTSEPGCSRAGARKGPCCATSGALGSCHSASSSGVVTAWLLPGLFHRSPCISRPRCLGALRANGDDAWSIRRPRVPAVAARQASVFPAIRIPEQEPRKDSQTESNRHLKHHGRFLDSLALTRSIQVQHG